MAMLSLFRVVTLEDWTDLMYIQMFGCEGYGYGGNEALCTASSAHPVLGALFFVSFVLLGTMITLNLFIGVIMNGMTEAQKENEEALAQERADARGEALPGVEEELRAARAQIVALSQTLDRIDTARTRG